MESYILAGVSLLILIPILYFLPLGFTIKGKVFVVLASLLIGMFGLISAAVFPLWQTGLILLLFVSSLAYLMSKRNLAWMYLQEDDDIDPFSIDEEEEEAESILPEIKPSYTYIAISEKNPRSLPPGEMNHGQNDDMKHGLLEKLISGNEKSLSMISKEENHQDFGEHELEELVLNINPTNEATAEIQNPSLQEEDQDRQTKAEVEDSQTVNLADVESKIEELVDTTEAQEFDPDIEAIIHKTEAEAEEFEAKQARADDSKPYISEIEQILETGEYEQSNEASLEEVPLPVINVEDILEPTEELEIQQEIKLENDPPQTWLNDEFELDEIELIPSQIAESKSIEEEKEKHKQAVEDNTMVKH
ncbi:hypothetical protein HHO41_09545 [Bacillus sp. DNRA2]|uniref:hypothetical protein n=1 Tax=Bacillus sp. DNRA2 TaxID=2723053 RepID=UPI00145DDAD0|nr:hypothetical protein [Bacillus sp. DNRA2]NMD70535.1 hypothetical protein [Bacillus sp. DNRA2]